MATRNPFLADWVRNAYSMEMGLVSVLEKQAGEVAEDSQLQQGIDRHLEATRHHVALLRDRLQQMGESVSAIRPGPPLISMYGETDGGGSDATLKTGLVDFVTESFEVASYQALSALARQMGDQDTARVSDQILQDEMQMVHALDQILPGIEQARGLGAVDQQQIERLDQEMWDALNAHDLDRFLQYLSDDLLAQVPGTSERLNKQEYRDYLRAYLSAFPDLHFDIPLRIVQDNVVVTHWIGNGTQDGMLRSLDGTDIPPAHQTVRLPGSNTVKFQDGKANRLYVFFDPEMLVRQLGGLSQAGPQGTQDNVRIAHESFDALNAHDLERWMNLSASDYRGEAPGTTSPLDRQQNRAYLQNFITAFPDLRFNLLRTISQGDYVVVDWSAIGTQIGPLHRPDGGTIPPTGRQARQFGSTTFELKDGKIRQAWVYFDMNVLMEQVGLR